MNNINDSTPDRDDFVHMHIGKAGSKVTRANFVDGFLNDTAPQQDGTPAALIDIGAVDLPANLEALADAGTASADKLAYFTGAAAMALTTFTSYARTLLSVTNVTDFMAALGVIGAREQQGFFKTKAAAAAATIPAEVLLAHVQGYALPGDGGAAEWVRTSLVDITAGSYPALAYFRSADRYMPDGSTNNTNGGYWLIRTFELCAEQFGASPSATAATNRAAIQAMLSTVVAGGEIKFLGRRTYTLDQGVTLATDHVTVRGRGTLKGADATDFQYLLDISDTTGVTIDGLSFDANAAGRGSAAGKLSCLKANTTVFNRLLNLTCKNTLGIAGPTSSIAISASGGVSALYADGLVFKNLGTSATTKPSDGIFIRGDYCHITNTYGENVTDHVVVLEGCNYSIIDGLEAENCTSFAAMSNDGSSNLYGNVITNITGVCNYFGSFGAALGIYTFGSGWISGCVVTNVSVRGATGAAGGGPAVMISGRVEGSLSNLTLQPGGSTGVMNQAILVDTTAGGRGITVSDSILEVEGSASVIRIAGTSDSVRIENNDIREGAYGIYADGTSSFTEQGNNFVSQSTDKIGLGGSAYYYGDIWQNWTPVFSSDIGNQAATFTGAPTVTKARIKRTANSCSIIMNWNATLLNVSPTYIAMTLPSWADALDNNHYQPATVLNDTSWAQGEVRPLSGGSMRIYRQNFANFSANANVGARVGFTFEVD